MLEKVLLEKLIVEKIKDEDQFMFEICWIEKSDEFMVKEFMVKKYGFELPGLKSQELKCIATFNMAISLSELIKLQEGCLMISFTNIF